MEHTESAHHLALILSNILLFFGIAGVVVPLLQRLRMPPVLAYLLCGVVIGPYCLALGFGTLRVGVSIPLRFPLPYKPYPNTSRDRLIKAAMAFGPPTRKMP